MVLPATRLDSVPTAHSAPPGTVRTRTQARQPRQVARPVMHTSAKDVGFDSRDDVDVSLWARGRGWLDAPAQPSAWTSSVRCAYSPHVCAWSGLGGLRVSGCLRSLDIAAALLEYKGLQLSRARDFQRAEGTLPMSFATLARLVGDGDSAAAGSRASRQ